jgi:hypothetical protein
MEKKVAGQITEKLFLFSAVTIISFVEYSIVIFLFVDFLDNDRVNTVIRGLTVQHDVTLEMFLALLGLYPNIVQPYTAAVFLELCQTNGTHHVSLAYRNTTSGNTLIDLPIPRMSLNIAP